MASSGGPFKVNARLARGTIGDVYTVQQRRTDCQKFVMRRIRLSSQASKGKVIVEVGRYEQLTKLHHPNLIHYESAFLDNSFTHICIVMERCEDQSLYIYVAQHAGKPLPEMQIMKWFSQIVLALDYLHGKKVVHGDLRAINVFLSPNVETCKVTDLRAIVSDGKGCSDDLLYEKCHISLNAAQHLPPEFWLFGEETNGCFTAPGDMYALGCLLYFLCCRRQPFDGHDFVSISRKVFNPVYPSAPAVYNKDIRDLITQLMQLDWRKRPDSATVVKMPCVSQQKPSLSRNSQQEPSAKAMKNLRAELRTEYGYVPLQSKSYPAEYSVDWSSLVHCQFIPQAFPDLHIAMFQQLVTDSKGVLPIPPLLLPSEVGVGRDGMPLVLLVMLQREDDELVLNGRLHTHVPKIMTPVKIRVSISFQMKSRHGNEVCQFTGKNVQCLQHVKSDILVRIYGIPWDKLHLKRGPQAQLHIECIPSAKFWYEGLPPMCDLMADRAHVSVDWTALKGARQWHVEWQRMTEKKDSALYLPPLEIPYNNADEQRLDILYVITCLQRDGSALFLKGCLHPQTPVENKLRLCISLHLEIPMKRAESLSLKRKKIVVPLKNKSDDSAKPLPQLVMFKLSKSDWQTMDVTRTPRMSIALEDLPSGWQYWHLGMAPLRCEASRPLLIDWNDLESAVPWQVSWGYVISPSTVSSVKAKPLLMTPSITVGADNRHLVCTLRRQADHLIFTIQYNEGQKNLLALKPLHLNVDVAVELTNLDGGSTEVKTNVKLTNTPKAQFVDECTVKLCEPKWSKLSTKQLPKLTLIIVPRSL